VVGIVGFVDFFLFLFALIVVVIGAIMDGVRGIGFGTIAWASFMASLEYGTPTDSRIAYMSILVWFLAAGDLFICEVFSKKHLDLRSFMIFSCVPPVVLLLLLNEHVELGILGLLILMLLNDDSIAKRLPQKFFNYKTVRTALALQVIILGLFTRSIYVIPYALLLWWWYKLTVGRYKAARTLQEG